MSERAVGVVLAAGAGSRLSPLTRLLPKALCPVGGVALVDLAFARLEPHVDAMAVNVHHGREAMEAHFLQRESGSLHVSVEGGEARGTAGALGYMADWIDGRDVLLTNADAWLPVDLEALTNGWDGERCRLLCVRDPERGDFDDLRYCGACLLPGALVKRLGAEASGLYEVMWRSERLAGRLDLVTTDGPFIDCGTVADYLAANLAASGGQSVIDPTASIGSGSTVIRSVVWPHAEVREGERLVDAVRTTESTVLVR